MFSLCVKWRLARLFLSLLSLSSINPPKSVANVFPTCIRFRRFTAKKLNSSLKNPPFPARVSGALRRTEVLNARPLKAVCFHNEGNCSNSERFNGFNCALRKFVVRLWLHVRERERELMDIYNSRTDAKNQQTRFINAVHSFTQWFEFLYSVNRSYFSALVLHYG